MSQEKVLTNAAPETTALVDEMEIDLLFLFKRNIVCDSNNTVIETCCPNV